MAVRSFVKDYAVTLRVKLAATPLCPAPSYQTDYSLLACQAIRLPVIFISFWTEHLNCIDLPPDLFHGALWDASKDPTYHLCTNKAHTFLSWVQLPITRMKQTGYCIACDKTLQVQVEQTTVWALTAHSFTNEISTYIWSSSMHKWSYCRKSGASNDRITQYYTSINTT